MVKLSDYQNDSNVSVLIPFIGIISLIVSVFFGIKLKWFRYRMNFPTNHDDDPMLLRTHSVTEIRENCSVGVYRQSFSNESSIIKNDNEFRSTSISSPSSNIVKSKSYERSSIFRWPFRSKLTLSRNSTIAEENNIRTSSAISSVKQIERKGNGQTLSEKNERLRKSIYERLNSTNSMSMPDLVQCDEYSKIKKESLIQPTPLTIQKGIEESLDESSQYHTVDEIQEIKLTETVPVKIIPLRESSDINILKELDEIVNNKEIEIEIPPRPATPVRRRPLEPKIDPHVEQNLQLFPPPIKPRKKNINYFKTAADQSVETPSNEIENINHEGESLNVIEIAPKSILKTQPDSTHHSKSNVHFINVPDTSSDDEEQAYEDVWSKIDIHRKQLMKNVETNSPSNSPPPLPKTPPPTADAHERDFLFA